MGSIIWGGCDTGTGSRGLRCNFPRPESDVSSVHCLYWLPLLSQQGSTQTSVMDFLSYPSAVPYRGVVSSLPSRGSQFFVSGLCVGGKGGGVESRWKPWVGFESIPVPPPQEFLFDVRGSGR